MNVRNWLTGLLALASIALAGPVFAAPCTLNDVSLTIVYPPMITYGPTACANNVVQGGGPLVETGSMNTQLGSTGFSFFASSDGTVGTGLGGVTFAVTAASATSGAFTVTWTEQPGLPNLPLIVDLEIGLLGGNTGDAYRIDNVILPTSPTSGTGQFNVVFLNNGGNIPTLSHMILAGDAARACVDCVPTQTDVPEPATMAMLGTALFGLGLAMRRRRQ